MFCGFSLISMEGDVASAALDIAELARCSPPDARPKPAPLRRKPLPACDDLPVAFAMPLPGVPLPAAENDRPIPLDLPCARSDTGCDAAARARAARIKAREADITRSVTIVILVAA